jgi:hypothetical protein
MLLCSLAVYCVCAAGGIQRNLCNGRGQETLSRLCETDTDGELAKGIRRYAPITAISKRAGLREETVGLKGVKATRNWFLKDKRPSACGNANCC